MASTDTRPWYREPWPWLLMAAPAAAVLAGAVTLWLAVRTSDGLVAEDYYKRGLAINQDLRREQAARALGIEASVALQGSRLRVRLTGHAPAALRAHLAHATRAGHDLQLTLARAPSGEYEAALPPLPAGRWQIVLEDPGREWRIVKESP
jgi:hypothetical protein